MKSKNIKKFLIIITLIVILISTVVFAESNGTIKGRTTGITRDSSGAEIFDGKYKAISNKDNYKDLRNELTKVAKQMAKPKISKENRSEFYRNGYSELDINTAEYLSNYCDKTPEQLLEIKGKSGDYTVKRRDGKTLSQAIQEEKALIEQVSGAGESTTSSEEMLNSIKAVEDKSRNTDLFIEQSGKLWDDVIKELKIQIEDPMQELGITDEKANELKEAGMSKDRIIQLGILAKNYSKSFDMVAEEFKSGKSFSQVDEKYWNEKQKNDAANTAMNITVDEKQVIAMYGVSQDEIDKCKKYGITGIYGVVLAKKVAEEFSMTIDKALDEYQRTKSWDAVRSELGGGR